MPTTPCFEVDIPDDAVPQTLWRVASWFGSGSHRLRMTEWFMNSTQATEYVDRIPTNDLISVSEFTISEPTLAATTEATEAD